MQKQLSIGMPVYNAERFLFQAIESLLRQTFADFELIISDNGSQDETENICRAFARQDGRIRYFREETNRGAAWNFNRVFELSTSEYFKWAAADDICHPTFLERCMQILAENPRVVSCHAQTQKIDAAGNILSELGDPTQGGKPERLHPFASQGSPAKRFSEVLLSSGWSVRSYGVIRREALAKTSLIHPCYGWEKVVMAELALLGELQVVPETLFSQRVHGGASTSLKTAAEQEAYLDPNSKKLGKGVRMRLLRGFVGVIFRHPLTATQRIGCLAAIAQYLAQFGKWKSVLAGLLANKGIGNAGKQLRSTGKQHEPREAGQEQEAA